MYVGLDPGNNTDPSGAITFQVGWEFKAGVVGGRASQRSGTKEGQPSGFRAEVGVAVGTREDGSVGVYGYSTEGGGRIQGKSLDLQGRLCTSCTLEGLAGPDVDVVNVDIPVGRADIGGGAGLRMDPNTGQVNVEVMGSVGVGVAQDFGSVATTQTVDLGEGASDVALELGGQLADFLTDPADALRGLTGQPPPPDQEPRRPR
jgi:hypothetical protein